MAKLVRDRIPEIIKKDGSKPVFSTVPDSEREKLLREKILEEAEEFSEDGSIEEAADVLEVLLSYLELEGKDLKDLEEVRQEKAEKRGSFREGILLEDVI